MGGRVAEKDSLARSSYLPYIIRLFAPKAVLIIQDGFCFNVVKPMSSPTAHHSRISHFYLHSKSNSLFFR